MSRYSALTRHLEMQPQNRVPMTFAEIEAIIGRNLPDSAFKHRPWWSNNASNSVMTKAWLEAGFRSEQVDMQGRRLVFRREGMGSPPTSTPPASPPEPPQSAPAAPLAGLYGALAGTVTIRPDTDLTAPTADDWRAEI